MRLNLFPFQAKAVTALRKRVAAALYSYNKVGDDYNQIISLQAPTGSGKTIIMAAFIEEVLYGTEDMIGNPNAIFVWLSDSPALNEQSRDKLELKSDRIKFGQCVTISEDSFDMETLADGNIYFLNTQKLSVKGKLGQHSDNRQYTIWETLDNTAREKADRLYFIIDEAHRGMQGREAGKATSIMQRFIKGAPAQKMQAMPLIIGMSATPERFNKLVENCPNSTLSMVKVSIEEVRASGLLKDRILVKYPGDSKRFNEMAMLQAATDEWIDKCRHWHQYTYEQHYQNVDPIFVIQVAPATEHGISATNLDAALMAIEEKLDRKFEEYEVVHTFGETADVTVAGLTVHYVAPSHIADNHKIRVVFFKENLSTGWDCPRAETMMSYRHAQDATYIAQLLGRMIRTPLGSRVQVDETLNDVSLFLPYYDEDTVKQILEELRNTEGSDIPTVVDEENMTNPPAKPWGIYERHSHHDTTDPNQIPLPFDYGTPGTTGSDSVPDDLSVREADATHPADQQSTGATQDTMPNANNAVQPSAGTATNADATTRSSDNEAAPDEPVSDNTNSNNSETTPPIPPAEPATQLPLLPQLDRRAVLDFINKQGFLTYHVRNLRINDYVKSLLDLASLLTTYGVYSEANDEVSRDITGMIHHYAEQVRTSGSYHKLRQDILEMKISVRMFDAFGQQLQQPEQLELFQTDKLLDRQFSMADAKLGQHGYTRKYENRYMPEGESAQDCAIDCILYAASDDCLRDLSQYAKKKYNGFIQSYRRKIANREENCRREYRSIAQQGDAVSQQILELPTCPSTGSAADGHVYYKHLYIDDDGTARIKLNTWEADVIAEESIRPDFICWVRNPAKAAWALTVPYKMGNEWKPMYPDFLIIRSDPDTDYVMDILEPHGDQYKDSLAKAKGLVEYAKNEQRIGRVQMLRADKDKATGKKCYRRLELTNLETQTAVTNAMNNEEFDHIFNEMGFVKNK